jgi:glycosyltransferase involved in cell wall biosynthesis
MIDYNVGDGGSSYELMVSEALSGAFDLSRYTLDFRKWGKLKYVAAPLEFVRTRRILARHPDHAVAIKTFLAALLNPRLQRSIVILHHLGGSANPIYSALERYIETYILEQIRTAHAVVVVSEYWRRYLSHQGLRNVRKIYNAFKVQEFDFTGQEIEGFKKRYGLLGKPIIYMGNHRGSKGVDDTFEVLRDLDVHFVASGHPGPTRSCIKCFLFERRDYLRLLAASEVAVTMSQFEEGWCRTAHEAMLCGTPVLGSGRGGMRELLESGGQIICDDFRSLRGLVEALLGNKERRAELGWKGYEFASQFTYERFRLEWIALVTNVLTTGSSAPYSGDGARIDPSPGRQGRVPSGGSQRTGDIRRP